MSTLEDWTDVFYINYYGCDKYRGGLYVTDEQDVVTAASTLCTKPQANPIRSTFFFFFFIIVSSLVLLSMFIGAITISMSECVETINQEVKLAAKQKQVETEKKLLAAHNEKLKTKTKVPVKKKGGLAVTKSFRSVAKRVSKMTHVNHAMHTNHPDPDTLESGEQQQQQQGVAEEEEEEEEESRSFTEVRKRNHEAKLVAKVKECMTGEATTWEVECYHSWLARSYDSLSKPCRKISNNARFQQFILMLIIVTGVFVGLSTGSDLAESETFKTTNTAWNMFAGFSFTLEVVLRFIGYGLEPHRFFFAKGSRVEGWNWFDLVVVVGSLMPGGGDTLIFLRMLRLLMVVKRIPQMRLAVDALVGGLVSIGYIGVLMVGSFYFFAIFAIILFKQNDPWHFGNLHLGMITLFRMSTLEDWTDVM